MTNPSYPTDPWTQPSTPAAGVAPAVPVDPVVAPGQVAGSAALGVSPGSVEEPIPVEPPAERSSTGTVAKDEAANVKDTAVQAGAQVAQTAKEQAAGVVSEATSQARGLLSQVRGEVNGQASTQLSRLAAGLHSMSNELGAMASKSEESGPMTDLVHQASRKGGEIAHWLQNREPADVLEEVRSFARRRPVAFLALCLAAGVVAGRATRGAVAANTSVDSPRDDARPAMLTDGGEYTGPQFVPPSPAGVPVAGVSTAVSGSYVEPGVDPLRAGSAYPPPTGEVHP